MCDDDDDDDGWMMSCLGRVFVATLIVNFNFNWFCFAYTAGVA